MIIKNQMTIEKRGVRYVCFNNLLTPALEFIRDLKPYSKFVAIGIGNSETTSDMVTLENHQVTLPLVVDSYNFDPANGSLFSTLKLVLDESNPQALEIVEVGLTGDDQSANPKIANRFLANFGEPIYRDPGEEMTIEISVFLEMSETDIFRLTAGSNALAKLLLGGGAEGDFGFARGSDLSLNADTVVREATGLDIIPATINVKIDSESKAMTLTISSDIGVGEVQEILLTLGGSVVARENVKEIAGVEEGLVITLTADDDNMVTFDKYGVNSITSVVDKSTATELADIETLTYATSFSGGYVEVFSGLGFDNSTERVISRQGNKIGFVKDGKMSIFDFSTGEMVSHICTNINASLGVSYMIFESYLFIRILRANGDYDLLAYELVEATNTYVTRNFYGANSSMPGTDRSDYWSSWDMGRMDSANDNKMFLIFSSPNWLYWWRMYLDGASFYTDTRSYTSYYLPFYVRTMLKSNRNEFDFVSFDTRDNMMLYRRGNGYFQTSTDPVAVDVCKTYDDKYPRVAKNFIYNIAEDKKAIKCYSIDSFTGKTLDFPNASEIFISRNFDYVAVREPEGIRLFYVDGSLNLYEFNKRLPEVDGAEIASLEFVGSVVLVFLSDGRIMSIKLNKDKYFMQSVEKGSEVEVTYSADNTPGLSGGNIKATATITTTI